MPPAPLRALVCGNVNVELAFAAPRLPLPEVESVEHPHALTLGVSGVGFNVAHALARLGTQTHFLGFAGDDAAFCRHITEAAGVAAIPVSAFYEGAAPGHYARFAFCKRDEVLDEAVARLARHFADRADAASGAARTRLTAAG